MFKKEFLVLTIFVHCTNIVLQICSCDKGPYSHSWQKKCSFENPLSSGNDHDARNPFKGYFTLLTTILNVAIVKGADGDPLYKRSCVNVISHLSGKHSHYYDNPSLFPSAHPKMGTTIQYKVL